MCIFSPIPNALCAVLSNFTVIIFKKNWASSLDMKKLPHLYCVWRLKTSKEVTTGCKIDNSLLVMKHSPSIQVFDTKPLMSTDSICGEQRTFFSFQFAQVWVLIFFQLERDTSFFPVACQLSQFKPEEPSSWFLLTAVSVGCQMFFCWSCRVTSLAQIVCNVQDTEF